MFIDDLSFFVDGKMPNNNYMTDNNSKKIVDCKIGYVRGNMFDDEYVPYKNFKLRNINPKTEEQALLLKLNEAEFALNDLSLYLDLHPNDDVIFKKFKEEVEKYKGYLDMYEKNYRPLNLCDTYQNTYEYYKNPWPWDNDGGVKYV